jgi:phage protein D
MSVAGATNADIAVTIGGKDIPKTEVHEIVVERDLDTPDMAAITLSNESTKYSEQITEGDDVEVKLGLAGQDQASTVFKGEITGIEPMYDTHSKRRVIIRCLNKMHTLARGKKSVAYTKSTDKQIVDQIVGNYGLTADYGQTPPSTQYDHVYQHNQTDLEFVRLRAARIGYEVFVDDTKLFFRKRDTSDSGIKLMFSGSGGLMKFHPRLSTANQVSEVKVRGYDPDNKKEIVGSAQPQNSQLGDNHGSKAANSKHSNVYAFDCDVPIKTKAEADAIAKAILDDRLMNFITGDAVSKGNPNLKPGIVVSIEANDKKFNGKYYITAVRHRYLPDGKAGGYRTEFKFKRDAYSAAQAQQQQQQQSSTQQQQQQQQPAAPAPPAAPGGGAGGSAPPDTEDGWGDEGGSGGSSGSSGSGGSDGGSGGGGGGGGGQLDDDDYVKTPDEDQGGEDEDDGDGGDDGGGDGGGGDGAGGGGGGVSVNVNIGF